MPTETSEAPFVWKAIMNKNGSPSSQAIFLNSPFRETLLHGSRGGGKTETAVMSFAKHVGKGHGERWAGVIFRRKYKDLDDVVRKSKRLFYKLYPEAKFLAGAKDYKWVWPTGEELMFRKFDNVDDYEGFHGQELPFILWEEITNWPDDSCYEIMKSCNRSVSGVPRCYYSTTNPSGPGHSWVKQYFIDAGDPYTAIVNKVGEKRMHVPSSVFENHHMDAGYVKDLFMIKDENKRKAWLMGSWDIIAGGIFSDVWRGKNICKPFDIPESWTIDRSFDWGSSRPFSVIWYAESDGTDYVDADGNTCSTTRGDVFAILEYYGASGPNIGLRMTARAVAIEIREYEMTHPALKGRTVRVGPADSQIWAVENGNCIATSMEKLGIYWTRADKSAGSRIIGWENLRERFDNAHNGMGLPSLKIFSGGRCRDLLRLIPVLPRCDKNPDDVHTESEDHNADSLRYRLRKPVVGSGIINI